MKLTFLGTGSAFTMKNWQTNMLVDIGGEKMLIDCGSDIRWALAEQGMSYLDIGSVFVSHLHADHIGGLEWLAFGTYFDPRYDFQPALYSPKIIVDSLWNNSLSGGLSSIQGQSNRLSSYFEVFPVEKNGQFNMRDDLQDVIFKPVQTIHIMNEWYQEPSFGLMVESVKKKHKMFITCDTQHCPAQISTFYHMADIIFHDCETAPYQSGVHAHYDQLRTLNRGTKAKMWLCHYQDNVVENWDEWQTKAKLDGFAGFVKKGQTFEF